MATALDDPDLVTAADVPLRFVATPIADIRAELRRRPLPPLEPIDGRTPAAGDAFRRELDDLLRAGWQHDGVRLKLTPPIRWTGHKRSFAFHLNAWDPIALLIDGCEAFEEPRYYEAARDAGLHWLHRFQKPALEVRDRAGLAAYVGRAEEFVWYDMGVGLRVCRMAWLLDRIARDETVADDDVRLALDGLCFHLEALSQDGFFRAHNNHGIYQALGQLAAARRFGGLPHMAGWEAQGRERLRLLLNEHFFPSGVHREHSPGYQQMLLGSLLGARKAGLLSDADLGSRLPDMEAALSWMTAPDGTLAPIGDTDPKPVADGLPALDQIADPGLRWQVTGGREGAPPPEGVRAYADAGYVFARRGPAGVRDPRRSAYLAQIAGFHSRTHKHADHLAFLWFDRGRPVLADPGRYGYVGRTLAGSELARDGFWYSDPRRVYVETTRAHNCVTVDGRNYPRARVRPFGSALVHAGEHDGLIVTECEARYFGTVRHRRLLILNPGEFLLVVDGLADRDEAPHDYVQRFQLAPTWLAEAVEGGVSARDLGAPDERLQVRSLVADNGFTAVERGREAPELDGWCSNGPESLVPACAFGVAAPAAPSARFATLFVFCGALVARGSNLAPTLTSGKFAWTQDGRPRGLSFRRGQERAFELQLVG